MLRKFCTLEKKKIGNKSRALRVRERAKRRSQKMVQFLTKYPRSWFDFENFARCWLAEVVCSAFSSSSLLRVVHFVVLVALILFFRLCIAAMMMMIKLLLQIFLFFFIFIFISSLSLQKIHLCFLFISLLYFIFWMAHFVFISSLLRHLLSDDADDACLEGIWACKLF